MSCENDDSKVNDDCSTSDESKDNVQLIQISRHQGKHDIKKSDQNNIVPDNPAKHHLSRLSVTVLIIVLLFVLGSGSYLYSSHKIIEKENLSVVNIDISSYPKVKIYIKAQYFNHALKSDSFSVKEMNTYPKPLGLIKERNYYILEYTSLQPSPKDSRINVSIYYKDDNKFIDLKTNYEIKASKKAR